AAIVVVEGLEVRPGAEGPTHARQDGDVEVVVGVKGAEGVGEGGGGGAVDGVSHLGAVDGDQAHAILAGDVDVAGGHGRGPGGGGAPSAASSGGGRRSGVTLGVIGGGYWRRAPGNTKAARGAPGGWSRV